LASIRPITGGVTGTNNLTIENIGGDENITFSTGSLNNAGTITHIGAGTGTATISSVIGTNVTGVVQNSASSALVLSGNNTYTGGTTLNAGLLSFANGSLGSSGNITLNGGVLQWGSGNNQNISSRLVLVDGSTATLDTGANSIVFSSAFGGGTTARLVKMGSGSLNLRGNNTFSGGLEILEGSILGGFGGGASATPFGTGAVTIGNAAGGSASAGLVYNADNNKTFTNSIVLAATTTGTLRVATAAASGGAFTATFTGGVTGTNNLTIENIGGDENITFSTGSLNNAGTITHIGAGTGTATISSVIGPNVTGVVQNSASSALVLSGNNTYTGATTVSAGSLIINGNQSAATGVFTVAAGATLGGSGTIGGATTISGTHSPGNSAGVQTFGSNLTYSGTPTVQWELTANTTTQGSPTPVFDQIFVNGNLDFAVPTTLTLNFALAGSGVDWSNGLWANNITGTAGWLLYDVGGTLSNLTNFSISVEDWADGQGDFFNTVRAGSSFSLHQAGNDIYLNYAVPEPSTYALLALAAAGLGAHIMRRRRR
jgi:fibronectin-binding autotransporter adhesin